MNQAELQFRSEAGGRTQTEALRDYFAARPGIEIAMPELALVITETGIGAAVHSRVNDCRQKFGMNIVNRIRRENGKSKSWYVYEPVQAAH